MSARHSTVPVHVRDIVLMTIRAQDSELATVEKGSDIENVLQSDSSSNGLSSIFKSNSSASPSVSPIGDVGLRKVWYLRFGVWRCALRP